MSASVSRTLSISARARWRNRMRSRCAAFARSSKTCRSRSPHPKRPGKSWTSRAGTRLRSDASIALNDLGEIDPVLAVETRPHHAGDRVVVGGTGVDVDTRQQHCDMEVMKIGRLAHDVLARQVVATLFQYLHHSLRDRVGV